MIKYALVILCVLSAVKTANAKQIALTFDDAPLAGSTVMSGSERTERIINHLKKEKVESALFFVTSRNIAEQKDINRLKSYTRAGFYLAHHSHDHVSFNKMSFEQYVRDFEQAEKKLTDFDNVLKLHRFPYLHYGESEQKRSNFYRYLTKRGYDMGYATVDNCDWYLNGQLVNAVTKNRL